MASQLRIVDLDRRAPYQYGIMFAARAMCHIDPFWGTQ